MIMDDCSQGAAGRTLEMLNNQPAIMQAAKSSKSVHFTIHYVFRELVTKHTSPRTNTQKSYCKTALPWYASRSSGDSTWEIALRNAGKIAQLELNLVANRNANHRRWSSAAALGPTCSFPARWPGHFEEVVRSNVSVKPVKHGFYCSQRLGHSSSEPHCEWNMRFADVAKQSETKNEFQSSSCTVRKEAKKNH